ncbi:hypothetical protein HNR37_001200 [Desulfurispira natronophila]|uniref:Uncharacterized protein n=1 Tax=Desulfurispira natronophila TaxID=682562 RepID=A0A7W8DGU6_9BACT|nr:hypothetical protein [Desulfurispira natronophila]
MGDPKIMAPPIELSPGVNMLLRRDLLFYDTLVGQVDEIRGHVKAAMEDPAKKYLLCLFQVCRIHCS